MIGAVFSGTPIHIRIYTPDSRVMPVKLVNVELPFKPIWDRELIINEQSKDAFCQAIAHQLNAEVDENNEEEIPYFFDQRGILYKMDGDDKADKLVIPKSFVEKAIHDFHNLPMAGHPGQAKTLSFIQSRLYWPGMRIDINKYISSCDACNRRKTPPHFKPAPLQPFPEILEPFERTAMDIVGPLVTSLHGNKYLLTFQDHFTKYPEAIPISDQTAETVAKIFVTHIVARHGAPKILITDQGTNFVSKLFKEVCNLLNIEKIQTTAYHPQSNGVIERSHRVFKDMLSHYISQSQQDWDEWIPYVLLAYRSQVHSSTGYTPFFLLHGRDIVLPFDDILKAKTIKYDVSTNYASELMARLNQVFVYVRENMQKSKDKVNHYFNKKSKEKLFELGDLVYLHDLSSKLKISKKIAKPWIGPYRIIEIKGPVNYRIKELGSRKELIVHVNRLKLYKSHNSIDDGTSSEGENEPNHLANQNLTPGVVEIPNEEIVDEVQKATLNLLPERIIIEQIMQPAVAAPPVGPPIVEPPVN